VWLRCATRGEDGSRNARPLPQARLPGPDRDVSGTCSRATPVGSGSRGRGGEKAIAQEPARSTSDRNDVASLRTRRTPLSARLKRRWQRSRARRSLRQKTETAAQSGESQSEESKIEGTQTRFGTGWPVLKRGGAGIVAERRGRRKRFASYALANSRCVANFGGSRRGAGG
jgi:hypothetical protein